MNWGPPPIPDNYPGEVCRGPGILFGPSEACPAQPHYIVESSDAKGEYVDLVCGRHLQVALDASMPGYGDTVIVRSFPRRRDREAHERSSRS